MPLYGLRTDVPDVVWVVNAQNGEKAAALVRERQPDLKITNTQKFTTNALRVSSPGARESHTYYQEINFGG
jgi:hypothetical protein